MKTPERAAQQFKAGLNCSQAVIGEFAEGLGLDYGTALKIACGFGGGMGRLGHTCGAVTGAIMVMGLRAARRDPRDPLVKARIYGLVRSFVEEFEARHETTSCRELLGCDISTPEGYEEATQQGLFQTRCPEYVADAVEILEEMFKREGTGYLHPSK
jgi:C_GCAxxG_C_C family probable redox protein